MSKTRVLLGFGLSTYTGSLDLVSWAGSGISPAAREDTGDQVGDNHSKLLPSSVWHCLGIKATTHRLLLAVRHLGFHCCLLPGLSLEPQALHLDQNFLCSLRPTHQCWTMTLSQDHSERKQSRSGSGTTLHPPTPTFACCCTVWSLWSSPGVTFWPQNPPPPLKRLISPFFQFLNMSCNNSLFHRTIYSWIEV